jgi:predicted transcriptional regulator
VGAILLPIKPEYVESIFLGSKIYEFRRRLPKKAVAKIVIYCTSPIGKVLGEAKVLGIVSGDLNAIWDATKNGAGITHSAYLRYFNNCEVANAYNIGDVVKYIRPKELVDFNIDKPPQSFVYLPKIKGKG